ncbi:bifunctional helix-turn-helix transcriptional regulator/GNAT family N-acetyltransferase [Arenimonas oryziterrae]|uniref:N-acetyltransferase domain-containing protein n=1 Tax=Arenimonas oryziterrae DSM 21050 = YC6267 TaxID=1121015 RepID=A0A091AXW1_9GAMM|nr:bifunctional helix-turn-helix transcriptional regulator/GNAT family N-acetyltransferase [Arenimonas oryziterrae]KFN44132.1 hypothetical protein N789_06870 [Arenimonas oryziterrae DSM 21050 = YC6267]
MNFLESQGALALASRLKSLSDRCFDAVDQIYREHGTELQSRWFPLLRLLQEQGPQTVGDAARALAQTHSAVSQLATKLVRAGWLHEGSGSDRRQRVLALTEKAETQLNAARPLWQVLQGSVEARIAASGVDLLQALSTIEAGLSAQPLPAEVAGRLGREEVNAVRIVPFAPALREHFYRLNAEWLSKYYRIEPIDHAVLSDPEKHILAPGGAIFFAVLGDEVLGTCALMPEAPGVFELTKMAVTERRQGLGIGRRLLQATIEEFRRLGGRELFLESQRRLQAALKLYERMGFEMQPGTKPGSHYQRADVYMIYRG